MWQQQSAEAILRVLVWNELINLLEQKLQSPVESCHNENNGLKLYHQMKMERLRIASDRLHVSSCGSAAPQHRHNVGNIKRRDHQSGIQFQDPADFYKNINKEE